MLSHTNWHWLTLTNIYCLSQACEPTATTQTRFLMVRQEETGLVLGGWQTKVVSLMGYTLLPNSWNSELPVVERLLDSLKGTLPSVSYLGCE